ncbi:MAG: succinate dehydrogenase assembly factor 2 [Hyphomicrobiaceae bacterium]|nr:MAG: succinate dehydrogenase assembly factor 2 [Hyphomicrobiaceae bacterium]
MPCRLPLSSCASPLPTDAIYITRMRGGLAGGTDLADISPASIVQQDAARGGCAASGRFSFSERAPTMTVPIDVRRRRALYRAMHRGTRELDLMVGRYAQACVREMDHHALSEFERLLSVPDPEIDFWLRGGGEGEAGDLAGVVANMRNFLGLNAP